MTLLLVALAFAGSGWAELGSEKGWMLVDLDGFAHEGNIEEVFRGVDWKAACPMLETSAVQNKFTIKVTSFGHESAKLTVKSGVTLNPGEKREDVDPLGHCIEMQLDKLQWSFSDYEAQPMFPHMAYVTVHYRVDEPIRIER
jgi:hypothetical protein